MQSSNKMKQGVALTGRNTTGPPCSVGLPTARVLTVHAPGGRPALPPAALQTTTDDDRMNLRKTYDQLKKKNAISKK